MTDARDPQPTKQTIDTRRRKTGDTWEIEVWTPVYGSIRQDQVYAVNTTFVVNATSFGDASDRAYMLVAALSAAHDIWQAKILRVEEKRGL